MENQLMISVDYLKANASITQNVNSHNIEVAINKAQRIHMVDILGRKLYDKVLADIAAETLTGVYQTLVDTYCSPSLVEWTMFYLYDFQWTRISEKGVTIDSSENSTPLSKSDIVYLKDGIRNSAELFDQKIIDYLIYSYNQGLFPEYKQNTQSNQEKPAGTTFFSGIYISPKNRCNINNCDFPYE